MEITGTGTVDQPISRDAFGCAVRKCPNDGTHIRVTNAGYFVRYCRQHEQDAALWFDRVDDEEGKK